ncbi:MAG TPA: hypothetical protein VLT33_09660, partial [Labilithrix sp.]|nr:hypothetical protein [Labilithrix sp.]
MDADPPATLPPPAGGYGAAPPSARFGPTDEPRAPRRDLTPFLTAAAILVSLSSVLVLVVLGCRRYVAVARTAEVRRELSQIASDAAAAHERDHRMCPSASALVPPDDAWISGRKYQSQRSDWTVDAPSNAGFACLGYEMTSIQYFQYGYA